MPQRYFLTEYDFKNHTITNDDAHHILRVMRMQTGDEIEVCYDKNCYISKITISDQKVSFEMVKKLEKKMNIDVTLIQGLPKGNKIDFVSKYATIFGVSSIIFVEMKRSIAKEKNTDSKLKRLKLIAKEAAELAHRFDVPNIEFLKNMKAIDFSNYDIILLADENEKTKTLNQIEKIENANNKIALIIGPEGGIDEDERIFLNKMNAQFISLGENIFPTEIASIYALSYFLIKKTELF